MLCTQDFLSDSIAAESTGVVSYKEVYSTPPADGSLQSTMYRLMGARRLIYLLIAHFRGRIAASRLLCCLCCSVT